MKWRPLTPIDLDAIDTLQPPDWLPYRTTFERYFTLPCVLPFGLVDDQSLVAMGTLIVFGQSGWLAQIITHPTRRGEGLGTLVVTHLLEEAAQRKLTTLSLVATEQGYPLYARSGFRIESEYAFWTRSQPAPPLPEASVTLLPGSEEHLDLLWDLDRRASGEARSAYFSGRTVGWTASDRRQGFFLPQIGEGLVIASSESAGVPLLHRRLDGATRVVVPMENQRAARIAEERGFQFDRRARRMVWGAGLERQPTWIWSRIGGNLG